MRQISTQFLINVFVNVPLFTGIVVLFLGVAAQIIEYPSYTSIYCFGALFMAFSLVLACMMPIVRHLNKSLKRVMEE